MTGIGSAPLYAPGRSRPGVTGRPNQDLLADTGTEADNRNTVAQWFTAAAISPPDDSAQASRYRYRAASPSTGRDHLGGTANGATGQRPAAPFIPPVWYRARPWDPPITIDAAC